MGTHTAPEVWVYGDLRTDRFLGFSLNVLAGAVKISRAVSGRALGILMETAPVTKRKKTGELRAQVPIADAGKACLEAGADGVLILQSRYLSDLRADVHAAVLASAVRKRSPLLVLFPFSEFSREVAARAARMCDSGLIAECLDFSLGPDGIRATCPSWGGEVLADIAFVENDRTGFASVNPHAFKALKVTARAATMERIPVGNVRMPKGVRRLSIASEPEEQQRLEEAEIVVVGGAGVGSVEGFAMVRQLAASLNGELGATRPPVLQHWVDGQRLIGQTGKTVRPRLLVTVGTSGALQYTAGILESKTIVAVNRDANAPIFQVADIGIVADAKTFLPELVSRVRQRVMRGLADALSEREDQKIETGFGARVRKLRESHGWSLENLAEATGQSPEFVRQVEDNDLSPSVSFLLGLAGALKVDPGMFLRREEQERIRDMRAQAYEKRTQSYNYRTLTDGATNDHLRAFLVSIESRQTHKPVAYKHEGEEFIYVLEGHLQLTLGGKTKDLKHGESIHFHSDIPHKLKNLSSETTRLLVVLYTL